MNCTWCRFHKKSLVNKDKKIFSYKKKTKTKNASHFHNTCLFRKISAKAVLIKKNQQMHFKQNTKAKQSIETNQHSKKTTQAWYSISQCNKWKKNQFLTFEKKGFDMWFSSAYFLYTLRGLVVFTLIAKPLYPYYVERVTMFKFICYLWAISCSKWLVFKIIYCIFFCFKKFCY